MSLLISEYRMNHWCTDPSSCNHCKTKNMKYRLIKSTNNITGYTKFVIQQKRNFFGITWWSEDYLFDTAGCYSFSTDEEDQAKRMLKALNGEEKWYSKEVVY